ARSNHSDAFQSKPTETTLQALLCKNAKKGGLLTAGVKKSSRRDPGSLSCELGPRSALAPRSTQDNQQKSHLELPPTQWFPRWSPRVTERNSWERMLSSSPTRFLARFPTMELQMPSRTFSLEFDKQFSTKQVQVAPIA